MRRLSPERIIIGLLFVLIMALFAAIHPDRAHLQDLYRKRYPEPASQQPADPGVPPRPDTVSAPPARVS